jgi:hypothetical protein
MSRRLQAMYQADITDATSVYRVGQGNPYQISGTIMIYRKTPKVVDSTD